MCSQRLTYRLRRMGFEAFVGQDVGFFDSEEHNAGALTEFLEKKAFFVPHGNGKITFSPAVQLLNIHQLDDMLKWFIKFSDGDWGNTVDISWMSQVWYPRICNYDTAPREYRLWVADKLEKSADIRN